MPQNNFPDNGLIVAFGFAKQALSKRFINQMAKPWNMAIPGCEAIQAKALSDFTFASRAWTGYTLDDALTYLQQLGRLTGNDITTKALMDSKPSMSNEVYNDVRDAIAKSARQYFAGLDGSRFKFNELVAATIDLLMIKNSLENGTGHEGLDSALKAMVANKPASFFTSGYVADLLVHDRIYVAKFGTRTGCVRCVADHLSTIILPESTTAESDPAFERYSLSTAA